MIQTFFRFTNLSLFAVLLLSFFSISSYAAPFYIDNFTDVQSVIDLAGDSTASTSTQTLTSTGSNLGPGTQRTLSIDASGTPSASILPGIIPAFNSLMQSNTGTLQISNDTNVTSAIASVFWDGFSPVNLTAFGTGLLLKVNNIDLATTIQLIINGGTSTSIPQAFASGTGNFFVPFTDFSDSTAFTAVNDIKLAFSGSGPWDGKFSFLVADDPSTVPEPSVLILILSGLLAAYFMSGTRHKKLS